MTTAHTIIGQVPSDGDIGVILKQPWDAGCSIDSSRNCMLVIGYGNLCLDSVFVQLVQIQGVLAAPSKIYQLYELIATNNTTNLMRIKKLTLLIVLR